MNTPGSFIDARGAGPGASCGSRVYCLAGLVGLLAVVIVLRTASAQGAQERLMLIEAEHLKAEATTLYQAGKFSQAELLFRRVLDLQMQVFGVNHFKVAVSLNNL